ncbi:MAG: hypothetical protein HY787_23585 [Deltaproteobacteria bacterium]|nr:hypothetical protein [Deltaproteobacteria bacterium]
MAKDLEKAGRGDCSLVIMNMLNLSYPENMDVRSYQARLYADFDPVAFLGPSNDLLESGSFPSQEAGHDIAYAADRMVELGIGNPEVYFSWIESTLQKKRSPELLAHYALRLRESQRYVEAHAVAKESLSLKTNGLHPNIAAALTASSLGLQDSSLSFIVRAFDIDAHATWWNMMVKYSSYFVGILATGAKLGNPRVQKLAEWLENKFSECPDLIYLPHRFTPWHVKTLKEKRAERISKGLPSPLLVTQNKSGSVSVANILSSGFDLPCVTYSLANLQVIPSMLREYLRGGACFVTHLLPTRQNIDLLKAAGIKKMMVHLRDPRQIVLSLAHHIQKYKKHDYFERQRMIANHSSNLRHCIDDLIDRVWLPTLKFQLEWLAASQEIDISFTTFEQFITDPPAFLERLLDAYGGDRNCFNRSAAFSLDINTDRHFRKGELEEWREVFTAAQIDRVNSTMPNDLKSFFEWLP